MTSQYHTQKIFFVDPKHINDEDTKLFVETLIHFLKDLDVTTKDVAVAWNNSKDVSILYSFCKQFLPPKHQQRTFGDYLGKLRRAYTNRNMELVFMRPVDQEEEEDNVKDVATDWKKKKNCPLWKSFCTWVRERFEDALEDEKCRFDYVDDDDDNDSSSSNSNADQNINHMHSLVVMKMSDQSYRVFSFCDDEDEEEEDEEEEESEPEDKKETKKKENVVDDDEKRRQPQEKEEEKEKDDDNSSSSSISSTKKRKKFASADEARKYFKNYYAQKILKISPE